MDNVVIPENLLWIVIGIGIVVQFLREFKWMSKCRRFIPYFAIILGVAGAYFDGVEFPACIQMGVAIGLMAAGGYDAIKAFNTKKVFPVLLILIGLFCFSGCGDVSLSPPYKTALQVSVVNTSVLNARCQGGDLVACRKGLEEASKTLQLLLDASNGEYNEGVE